MLFHQCYANFLSLLYTKLDHNHFQSIGSQTKTSLVLKRLMFTLECMLRDRIYFFSEYYNKSNHKGQSCDCMNRLHFVKSWFLELVM